MFHVLHFSLDPSVVLYGNAAKSGSEILVTHEVYVLRL